MKLKIFAGCEPVVETKRMVSGGVEKLFGLHRDRMPDAGWGEWRWSDIEGAVEVDTKEMTPEKASDLTTIVVEDLLQHYTYNNPKKIREKLEEFGIVFNFKD